MKHIKLFEDFLNEALHPNLSKKNLAKLKKLGHTGMKSAILWTDGHGSNPTYIQIPGEDGSAWGSKGPEDRTTFYWDGEKDTVATLHIYKYQEKMEVYGEVKDQKIELPFTGMVKMYGVLITQKRLYVLTIRNQ